MLQAKVCPVFQINCPLKSNLLNAKEKHLCIFNKIWLHLRFQAGRLRVPYPLTVVSFLPAYAAATRHRLLRVHAAACMHHEGLPKRHLIMLEY